MGKAVRDMVIQEEVGTAEVKTETGQHCTMIPHAAYA